MIGTILRQVGVSDFFQRELLRVGDSWEPVLFPCGCLFSGSSREQGFGQRINPEAGFSEVSEGSTGSPVGCLPQSMEKGRDSWPNKTLIPIVLPMGSCLKALVFLLSQAILGQEVAPWRPLRGHR